VLNGYRVLSRGVKRPELSIDHSSLSEAGVKNEWSYKSTQLECIYGWNRKKLPLDDSISVQTKLISSCCSCKLRFDLCLASFKSAQLAIVIAEILVSCSVIVQGNTVII
jgi:hypothetical protein